MLKYFDLIGLNQIIKLASSFLSFVLQLLEKLKLLITCIILLLNSAILEEFPQGNIVLWYLKLILLLLVLGRSVGISLLEHSFSSFLLREHLLNTDAVLEHL